MGLHISSINGLKSASGYELFVLTYGLGTGGPEFRAVQENFQFMADALGTKGIVITGSYDKNYNDNFSGFLSEVEDKLFSTSMLAKELSSSEILPVPALVVLKKSPDGKVTLAYLSILNFTEQEVITTFRNILSHGESDSISDLPGNLLGKKFKLGEKLWEAIQIRPNFFGVGIDVKELLKR